VGAREPSFGKHTFNHLDLGKTSVEAFIEDIAKQDQLLTTLERSPKSRSDQRFSIARPKGGSLPD
jgi:hypothetical protein